jgi:hypothetical protein
MVWELFEYICSFFPHFPQAAYDAKAYKQSMSLTQKYESAFNFMHIQNPWTAMPGIPLLMSKITNLMNHEFTEPKTFDDALVVVLDSPSDDPMLFKGGLRALTPEELRYAFVFAIARDINAGKPADVLERWRVAILTATVRFVVIPEAKEVYWAAHTMRERMVTRFGAVKRTVFQRIYEVVKTQERMAVELKVKNVSAALVAGEYSKKADISPESEPVSFSFVDAALTCYTRALCIPSVRAAIEFVESHNYSKHSFDSIYKLQGIVQKGVKRDRIEWMFSCVLDMVKSQERQPDEFSVAEFTGGKKKHLCLSDVLVMKLGLKNYLLGPWLGRLEFNESYKELIRKNLASHSIYRDKLCALPEDKDADLSWRSGWPKSASEALFLIEVSVR